MKINFLILNKAGNLRSGWRVAIFLFFFILVSLLLDVAAKSTLAKVGYLAEPKSAEYFALNAALSLLPAILIGWLCGKLLESLPFRALGAAFTNGWLKHFASGLIIGSATLIFGVLIAYGFGGLRFEFNSAPAGSILRSLALSLGIFAIAAAFEEALFRGYILQTFARSGMAWMAILLTSLFFGAVHANNPSANDFSTINTILAGIWFSVAYLKTRDLWFVWGLHLIWNWMQGSIFGIEVSGLTEITSFPLLREIDSGPTWLTGESYGIEGGIVCTIALAVSTVGIHFLPWLKPDEELLEMTSPKSTSP